MTQLPATCCDHASGTRTCTSAGSVGTRTAPDKVSLRAVCMLIALIVIPMAAAVVTDYTSNESSMPSDEDLTANFLSHKVEFNEIEAMLTSDRRTLRLGGDKVIDLKGLAALAPSAARMDTYRRLLRQISVADLRYFPSSGEVILIPEPGERDSWVSSKSYIYLPYGEPQPTVQHRDYPWRGPGLTFLTGDRRITGNWLVHYNAVTPLGVSPY